MNIYHAVMRDDEGVRYDEYHATESGAYDSIKYAFDTDEAIRGLTEDDNGVAEAFPPLGAFVKTPHEKFFVDCGYGGCVVSIEMIHVYEP